MNVIRNVCIIAEAPIAFVQCPLIVASITAPIAIKAFAIDQPNTISVVFAGTVTSTRTIA